MDIGVIGAGYVGLVTALGLSKIGHNVINYEKDIFKLRKISSKDPIINEKGIRKLLKNKINKSYFITNKLDDLKKCEVLFVAVNTPHTKKGIYLGNVISCLKKIKSKISKKEKKIIVIKSTVIPGTLVKKIKPIYKNFKNVEFVSNPEFLREGSALDDFLKPDRIIIGADKQFSKKKLINIYKKFKSKIIFTNETEAEMSKYFSNIFLANLISFSNEFSDYCSLFNKVNYYNIINTFFNDRRFKIENNKKFFYPSIKQYMTPGPGYGGSCFPKDTKSLLKDAEDKGLKMGILKESIKINDQRSNQVINLIKKHYKNLSKKTFLIIGLGFKPGTNDLRESKPIYFIERLKKNNSKIIIYDKSIILNEIGINQVKISDFKKLKIDGIICFSNEKKILSINWNHFCKLRKCKMFDMRGNLSPSKRVFVIGKNF